MANLIFENSFEGNDEVKLANKMNFETLKRFLWGKWAGYTTPKGKQVRFGDGVEPMPVEAPLIIHRELMQREGDIIKVPMLRKLDNLPKHGNDQLEGFEEKFKVSWLHGAVENTRHAVLQKEGAMSSQTTKTLLVLERSKPALRDHYTRFLNASCSYAMYWGHSYQVLTGSTRYSGSTKITAVSHPHFFTAGAGKVGYSGGNPSSSGYETAVATAIDAVGSSDVFDMALISDLKTSEYIQKIDPLITKDGNFFRIIIAHSWQIAQLEADPNFKSHTQSVLVQAMAKDNPMIAGAKYFIHGFAIFESDTAVWPVSTSGGAPVYGPSSITTLSSFETYSGATKFGAIVLGSSALALVQASGMRFIGEGSDYGARKGLGYEIIDGVSRGDFWNRDDGTLGDDGKMINQSSAIVVTYSPNPGF